MPPTMPEMTPEKSGAPEASAMPSHSGRATRNTTSAAGASSRALPVIVGSCTPLAAGATGLRCASERRFATESSQFKGSTT